MIDCWWDGEQWRDEWDERVAAVTAERDRVAASVDGPVPLYGSREWAAADERIRAASQARYEQAVAVARGREVSDRMAAGSAVRAAHAQAQKDQAAALARLSPLPEAVREQRAADAQRRAEVPRPWEDGYADSFAHIPEPRTPGDVDLDAAIACAAAAVHAAERGRREPAADDAEGDPHRGRDEALVDVDEA